MDKVINLSLARKSVPIRMDVVQYATLPRIAFVLDDYTPSLSAVANLYIKKPDGTLIYNSCTIEDNVIIYEPTTQSFAAVGVSTCQLQIIEPNDTGVSFLIYADVTPNIIDSSAIESQDEFTALEEALQQIGDLTELENRVTIAEGDIDNLEGNITTIEGDIDTIEGNVATNATDIANLKSNVAIRTLSAGQTLTIDLISRQCLLVMSAGGSAAQHKGAWIVMASYSADVPAYIELKASSSVNISTGAHQFIIENVSTAKEITIIGAEPVTCSVV